MFEKSFYYKNTDVLLMDPCFSRIFDFDIDSELYCSDMVVDIGADGYYYVIKGRLEEMKEKFDEIADNPEKYSFGEIAVETARIGVYDYQKAIDEQPELKKRIENKKNYCGHYQELHRNYYICIRRIL